MESVGSRGIRHKEATASRKMLFRQAPFDSSRGAKKQHPKTLNCQPSVHAKPLQPNPYIAGFLMKRNTVFQSRRYIQGVLQPL